MRLAVYFLSLVICAVCTMRENAVKFRTKFTKLWNVESDWHEDCLANVVLFVPGFGRLGSLQLSDPPHYTGGGSRVYLFENFVVKVSTRKSRHVAHVSESVMLDLLENTHLHITRYFLQRAFHPKISTNCLNRILVVENVGKHNLEMHRWNGKVSELVSVGTAMVRLVQELHLLGFVHGDVHPGNFVYSVSPQVDLRLIDWGTTRPHVRLTKEPQVYDFDASRGRDLASIFKILAMYTFDKPKIEAQFLKLAHNLEFLGFATQPDYGSLIRSLSLVS